MLSGIIFKPGLRIQWNKPIYSAASLLGFHTVKYRSQNDSDHQGEGRVEGGEKRRK